MICLKQGGIQRILLRLIYNLNAYTRVRSWLLILISIVLCVTILLLSDKMETCLIFNFIAATNRTSPQWLIKFLKLPSQEQREMYSQTTTPCQYVPHIESMLWIWPHMPQLQNSTSINRYGSIHDKGSSRSPSATIWVTSLQLSDHNQREKISGSCHVSWTHMLLSSQFRYKAESKVISLDLQQARWGKWLLSPVSSLAVSRHRQPADTLLWRWKMLQGLRGWSASAPVETRTMKDRSQIRMLRTEHTALGLPQILMTCTLAGVQSIVGICIQCY